MRFNRSWSLSYVTMILFVALMIGITTAVPALITNVVAISTNHMLVRSSSTQISKGFLNSILGNDAFQSLALESSRLHGVYLFQEKKYRQAAVALARAGEETEHMVRRGRQNMVNGRWAQAEQWFLLASDTDRTLADPFYYLGRISVETGRPVEALELFEQGLEATTYDSTGPSDFLLLMGLTRFQELDPPQLEVALDELDEAILKNEFRAERANRAYFARGSILQRLGQLDEAKNDYLWLINENAHHYLAHVRVAALHIRKGETVLAEQYLLTAISINPSESLAYSNLADMYLSLGDSHKAIRTLQALLEISPQADDIRSRIDSLQD